jgi:hypothetical protein
MKDIPFKCKCGKEIATRHHHSGVTVSPENKARITRVHIGPTTTWGYVPYLSGPMTTVSHTIKCTCGQSTIVRVEIKPERDWDE